MHRTVILVVAATLVALPSFAPGQASAPATRPAVTANPTTQPVTGWRKDWMQMHDSFVRQARQGQIDLLFIGDSITEGWDGQGTTIWQKYYQPRKAANFGIVSDRTQQVLWRLARGELENIAPKVVVLLIGTNNITDRRTPQEILQGVNAIIAMIRDKSPKSRILLLGVFPRGAEPADAFRQPIRQLNQLLAKLDDGKAIRFLDIGAKFLESDGSISKETMGDYLHLTAKGYETWAQAMEPLLTELMGPAPGTQPAGGPAAIDKPAPKGNSATQPAVGHRKDWMKMHESFVERSKQGNIDLLFVGDSITEGWTYNKAIWDKNYAPLKAANYGVAADRTSAVLWRMQNGELDNISPKVVVLMVGINNLIDNQSPQQVAEGIEAAVNLAGARLPGSKVLLLGVLPSGQKSDDPYRERVRQVNQIIAKLDDGKRVRYLDMGAEFLQPDGSISKEILFDFLHPSPKGYEIWVHAMTPLLAEMMGSPATAPTTQATAAATIKKGQP